VTDPIPTPVRWQRDAVVVLDQRVLPHREEYLECRSVQEVAAAIRDLAVRGAPILGITASFGVALAAARAADRGADREAILRDARLAGDALKATRPTAVNIAWAVDRVLEVAGIDPSSRDVDGDDDASRVADALIAEAERIRKEDVEACTAIGVAGAELIPDPANVLTHCNTGMLCTAGIGTAQGAILTAHRAGKRVHVWVDETRPVLQGARLTAWELGRLGVPRTLVADGAAASLMAGSMVDLVMVGADRIAANGDVANKIGTYGLAVLAHHHGIPFYVAAPSSSVDPSAPSGAQIVVEERDPAEVRAPLGLQVAAADTPVANPAFDVTPAALVSALVTEHGVIRPPFQETLRRARSVRGAA
jgi:methylthioribose-1-phosphate isomerase